MRRWRRALALIVLFFSMWSVLAPAPSRAQGDVDEATKEEARRLGDLGFMHYNAGEFAKAIPYFRDAEAKYHAPTLLLFWAHSHMKLEQYVEARDLYQRILNEPLPEKAPQPFIDAQTEATKKIEIASVRISTLKITLKGMTPEKITLTIDDVEIPTDKILKPIEQNPGTHKVVALLGGEDKGRAVFQSVTLQPGSTKQIQLVFRPGDPKNVGPPPGSGGCSSCAIGAAPSGRNGGLAEGAIGAVLVGLSLALRRQRRR